MFVLLIGLGLSVLRIGLIPLFMFCNAAPHSRQNLPVIFNSDTVSICLDFRPQCPVRCFYISYNDLVITMKATSRSWKWTKAGYV